MNLLNSIIFIGIFLKANAPIQMSQSQNQTQFHLGRILYEARAMKGIFIFKIQIKIL